MAILFDDLLIWVSKRITMMAEDELRGSKENIHEELLSLQARLDAGEMSEAEYSLKEDELLARLEEFQNEGDE